MFRVWDGPRQTNPSRSIPFLEFSPGLERHVCAKAGRLAVVNTQPKISFSLVLPSNYYCATLYAFSAMIF